MLIYLRGEDGYLAKQTVGQIKQRFRQKNPSSAEINIYAGEESYNWADLSLSNLFGEKQLLTIYAGGRFSNEIQSELATYLPQKSSDTIVVFWDEVAVKNPELDSVLLASPKIIDVSLTDRGLIAKQIALIANKLGVKLSKQDIGELTAIANDNLWFIDTHLAKRSLGYYEVIAESGENERFAYYNALREKNFSKIIKCIQADYALMTPVELVIGSLNAAMKKYLIAADRRPLSEKLLGIDIAVKTGLINDKDAYAMLVILFQQRDTEKSAKRVLWEKQWEEVL